MPRTPGPGDPVPDRWIRDAGDRQAIDEGCYFDAHAGDRVIEFFGRFLRHSKGDFAGDPFVPLDWQADFLRRLYGWKRPDGRRRFNEFALWVPKKNGKSTKIAGLEIYHAVADGEAGPEVYTGAVNRKQASIIHREAASMVKRSPALRKVLKPIDYSKRIVCEAAGGFIEALSADVESQEGLNASATFIDEIHAHKSPKLYQTLRYAGAARRQPLLGTISTAGYDRTSIGYNLYDYTKKVIAGIAPVSNFLGVVYEAPEGSDPEDPATWAAANPSLGHTIDPERFREDFRSAKANPLQWLSFLRYRLNVWTQAESRWLRIDHWNACDRGPIDPDALAAVPCWGGLDLASTTDLAAFPLLFATGDVILFAWCPEDIATERERRDRVFYDTWARQGIITRTPGSSIDYDRIGRDLIDIRARFPQLRRVHADPWNATDLATRLRETHGFPLEFMRQGFASMNEPCKALEKRIIDRELNHAGNPLLSWAADNAIAETDAAGNVKLSKAKSREKIDPIVGLVMAEAARIADAREGQANRSPYETMKPRRL